MKNQMEECPKCGLEDGYYQNVKVTGWYQRFTFPGEEAEPFRGDDDKLRYYVSPIKYCNNCQRQIGRVEE